jgi:two-component system, NarL family, nitrate/nitrite response regulator NarL
MRLLLADDHDLVCETIAAYLQVAGFDVWTAGNHSDALSAAGKDGPFDLVLLDYYMPGMNRLGSIARMIEANEGRPVAILSGTASRAIADQVIRLGAAGFVPKTMAPKSMVSAVRFMIAGETFAPYNFMQQKDAAPVCDLTTRETEVLRALCEGKSNKQIALDLDLQEVTVKLHVRKLSLKLEARNRTHAAMIARDRCLF